VVNYQVNATALRLAATAVAVVVTVYAPVAVAQRSTGLPSAGVEQGRDVIALLESCHKLPRKQELICAEKILLDYVAELERLLPKLEARIREHRDERANQEAAATRLQTELARLDGRAGASESSSADRQAWSKRRLELHVYIASTRLNIDRERAAIDEKATLLDGGRNSLATVRNALRQIRDELKPPAKSPDLPAGRKSTR